MQQQLLLCSDAANVSPFRVSDSTSLSLSFSSVLLSRQADFSDSNAVADLLDVLLAKVRFFVVVVTTCVFDVADTGENRSGKLVLSTSVIMICSQDGEEQNHEASSPPFFCGSPPDRAANPVVHDARFGEDRPPLAPFAPVQPAQSVTSMSPKHAKFGLLPAAVRVEGFDCLDRGCSSIAAVA
ncbi:hypothetical protein MUK42_30132 [Musa troglodytarum]|uniref:Uncharacterized protein n=1 Tax=Musa troglodytarum TaxID=320322 RepID=A0A9E7KSZ1_9LILI|nr:hypothetical protein MUK42_30132 [Musa troglodytarum]